MDGLRFWDGQSQGKDDASEASAGWYWQFNRKQGYKHDGTIRTPNSTWITSISENSDWAAANDPCSLQLGSVWRLPTYSEWTNVANWTDWDGAWNSGLKLHGAGYVSYSNGSLYNRGWGGYQWSSTQFGTTGGIASWCFQFWSGYLNFNAKPKADGNSVRCLREN